MLKNRLKEAEVQEPFVPLLALENAFRYWWVIAVLMVVGGLVGLFVHSFNPPIYEATGEFSVAIDYVGTGPLTQYEEDLAINAAGNVFLSTDVLHAVVDQSGKEGLKTSLADLKKQITLERRFSLWTIRVRDADPARAERLASIWMDQGQSNLLQSYQHAIQAYQLDRYVQSQENCLKKLAVSESPGGQCENVRFADVQQNLRDAGVELFKEKQASRGLFAGLTIGPFNPPQLSPSPVTYGRNQLVMLGSLLGLILGVTLIESGAVNFIKMKS